MGLEDGHALASLRISTGRSTTMDDIQKAVFKIKTAVNQLKTVAL